MESLSEFLQMGGYGGYVWFCFGAAVAMKAGFLIHFTRQRQRLLRQQQQ